MYVIPASRYTTARAFAYGLTESLGETAIAATLTAARWGVLTYDVLSSDEAKQTYRWVKEMSIALGQLVFWSAVWAWAKASTWAEAEVQGCIAQPAAEVVEAEAIADPFDQPEVLAAIPAAIAAPVATLPAKRMTRTQRLRQECSAKGIQWRNAHGTKHMSNAEMEAALAIA